MDVNRDPRDADRISGSTVISYPFRLAAAPKIEILFGPPGSSSACRGDVANPTSPPGYLCVYVGNPTTLNAGNLSPYIDTFDPAKPQGAGERGRYGVILDSGSGSYYGNWSLTAP